MDKIRCKYCRLHTFINEKHGNFIQGTPTPERLCIKNILDCFHQLQKTSRTTRGRGAFPCMVLHRSLRTCASCCNAVVTLHRPSLQQSPTRCSSEYEVQRNRINYYYLFICYRENLIRQRYDQTRLVESTSLPNNGPILHVEGKG